MRLKRVDAFRLYAIYMVVWIHAQFFGGIRAESAAAKGLALAVDLIGRAAVPFFFIVSGYFLGGKILEQPSRAFATAWSYSRKLLLFLVFWCIVYALENPRPFLKLAVKDPVTLLFQGTRVHLWFLVSLFLTTWLFALWPLDKKGKSFLVFGVLLYGVGLLGGSYRPTPVGLNLAANTRNGIYFSAVFFAVGVLFAAKKPRVSPAAAWGVFLGGLALFSLETWYLWVTWSAPPLRHDYLIGSVPYGIGAFLIAFAAKRETALDRLLAPCGKYVFGVYVSHMVFLDLLKPLGAAFDPLLWAVLCPAFVFGSALLAVVLLSKTPLRGVVV